MDPTQLIVDTNILFASLLHRQSRYREVILTDTSHHFYSPRFIVVEIFKHKERIAAASQLTEDELLECLNSLLARLTFVHEDTIPIGTWMEGRRLRADVDLKDSPFVALTLHLDGLLWSDDADLKTGLRIKGFSQFFIP